MLAVRILCALVVVCVALAFQSTSRFGNVRSFSRVLEMVKKSVGSLTEADLKGKRLANTIVNLLVSNSFFEEFS